MMMMMTMMILIVILIVIMIVVVPRWEEMASSGEKDSLDFQPLTQFLKCYAIYFNA